MTLKIEERSVLDLIKNTNLWAIITMRTQCGWGSSHIILFARPCRFAYDILVAITVKLKVKFEISFRAWIPKNSKARSSC